MLSCFLCEKMGNVKKFTPDRIQKCHKMLAFRKKKAFKYKDIELPVTASLHLKGYHIDCYNRFIVLKGKNREEFENMFSGIDNIWIIGQEPNAAHPKGTPSTSNTNNSIEIEITMPKPFEIPTIKAEMADPIETCDIEIIDHDIKQELAVDTLKIPTMENPFPTFEPSYLNPDISKAVILKSILTRKSPIKKDMSKDSFAFNSGMDLLRPIYGINQADLNPPIQKLEPKIMNTTTLADTGTCLFCNKNERKIGTKREFPSKSNDKMYEKVLSYAKGLNDDDLLGIIKDEKTFSFHPLCRTEYRNKYEKLTRKNCDDQDWLVFKNLHAEAFEGLCAFIDDKIIDKHKIYFLSDLYERYKALLYEIQNSSNQFDFESYSPQNLQEKIVNRYYGIIDITTSKVLKRKIVYKSKFKTNFNSAVVENEDQKYDKLAFELRSAIKSMKRGHSENENSQEIPEKLFRFVGSLIQGPDVRRMNSYEDCLKIKSMCEDIVDRITKED